MCHLTHRKHKRAFPIDRCLRRERERTCCVMPLNTHRFAVCRKVTFFQSCKSLEALTICGCVSLSAVAFSKQLTNKFRSQIANEQPFDRSQNSDTHTLAVHDACIRRRRRSESFSFWRTTTAHIETRSALGRALRFRDRKSKLCVCVCVCLNRIEN